MNQRPQDFRFNPQASLAKGLVFAGLGRHPKSKRYTDSSLYKNTGTLTNMDPATDWVWSPELNRWGLDFDGSDDYVNAQAPSPLPFTFSVWFYVNTIASNQGLMCVNDGARSGHHLYIQTSGKLVALSRTSISFSTFTDNVVTLGKWHHACGTFAPRMRQAFLDGQPSTTNTVLAEPTLSLLQLGRVTSNYSAEYMSGGTCDHCCWNRILSTAEIQALADPSNVMLSGLLLPPRRRLWPVGSAAETVEASLSESLAAGDSLVAALSALAAGSEGSSLGDTQAATATGRPTVSDGTALGDAAEASATLRPTEADGATLGDSQEAATTGRPSTTDRAALGDIQAAEATLRRSLVDGVIAGEQWAVRFTRAATIADGSLAGDSFQALVLTTIQSALSEGTQAGSTFAAGLLAYGAITEGVRTSDAYAAMVAAVASMADSATLGDVFAIVRVVSGAVTDGAIAGDAFVAALAHYVRGPYRIVAAQVHSAGIAVGQLHTAGPTAAQVHSAGIEAGQIA